MRAFGVASSRSARRKNSAPDDRTRDDARGRQASNWSLKHVAVSRGRCRIADTSATRRILNELLCTGDSPTRCLKA
jgi:hypothetical protein